MRPHVLVARLDNAGDVLLMGPAVRAVACGASRVTILCGPQGRAAAALLPGVDQVIVHAAPWVLADPQPVDPLATNELVDELAALGLDQAIVFTSFHQSPLPLALLLRLAGVPTVVAISEDYPGSLLDVRHRVPDDIHEVERALSLASTLGYRLAPEDDGRLAVRDVDGPEIHPRLEHWRQDDPVAGSYVVVHPGASVPARAWGSERNARAVDALVRAGWRVVVTGGPGEESLTAAVAGPPRAEVVDLGGQVDLAGLAQVLRGAAAVVVGNTGPAHLAAAVGTPVVSLFAPTVPSVRWRPWGVPHVLLGAHDLTCAGCRARVCPVDGHPCLDGVEPQAVVSAVAALSAASPSGSSPSSGPGKSPRLGDPHSLLLEVFR